MAAKRRTIDNPRSRRTAKTMGDALPPAPQSEHWREKLPNESGRRSSEEE